MLKITRVKLELPSDVNMLRLIQNGIRGGIAMVSNRFGQANNKYMGNAYDSVRRAAAGLTSPHTPIHSMTIADVDI